MRGLLQLVGGAMLAMAFTLPSARAQDPFAVDETCAANTDQVRFDITSLECETCSSDMTVGDHDLCTCEVGWLTVRDTTNPSIITCDETCAQTSRPTWSDNSACTTCDAGTSTYDATVRDCVCLNSNAIVVEYDVAGNRLSQKSCVACPSNTWVDSDDRYTCQTCPDPTMTLDGNGLCTCNTALYVMHNSQCLLDTYANNILTTYSPDAGSSVVYRQVRDSDTGTAYSYTVTSHTINSRYLAAAVNCKYYRYREDCQALANFCSMQLFDPDSTVCLLIADIEIATTSITHGYREWKSGMPLLAYVDDRVLNEKVLTSTIQFHQNGDAPEDRSIVSELLFRLAKYDVDGNYLGMEDLTDQLQFCEKEDNVRWSSFGTSYDNRCSLSLSTLLETEQVFYELYYIDQDSTYYPVPVKVVNYQDNGDYPNRVDEETENFEEGNLQLHRRFFMVDNVSSKRSATADPDLITFAQSITLRVQMQEESTTHIYPPVLSIVYGQRKTDVIAEGGIKGRSEVSFEVEYFKDDAGIREARAVLFGFAIVAMFVTWMGRMYIFQRTNLVITFDIAFLARSLLFLFSAAAELFFWLIFVLDFYAFVFYKGQMTVYFLLPVADSDLYSQHNAFIAVAFFGKGFNLMYRVWCQTYADIFFVDWERPKEQGLAADEEASSENVSVWRKLMVVNIWNDLQTMRVVDIHLTLFFLVFLLYGAGLENLATTQPSLENIDTGAAPINVSLRFCVSSLMWLIVAGGQLLFHKLIYQQYMENKAGQFVDLLNLTNISAFIFDQRYRCYYIHGESVSKYADVSLEKIFENLKAFQDSATQNRGLDRTNTDTWVVYTSREFRVKYEHLYSDLLMREELARAEARVGQRGGRSARRGGQGDVTRGGGYDEEGGVSHGMLQATQTLNQFLRSFINKHDTRFPRQLDSRSYIENRFNVPPATRMEQAEVTLFYPDEAMSFTNATLMGIEYELIIFYALLHAVSDLLWDNTLVSLLLIYIVDRVMVFCRSHWGKINLSKKTLVDYRFLI